MTTDVSQITNKKSIAVQTDLFTDNLPKEQKEILGYLKQEPSTIDELSRALKKGVSEIGLTISLMSLSDLVEEENRKIYLGHGL